MGQPVRKRDATYADIVAAPPHLVAEIVEGELMLSPRPSGQHAGVETGMVIDVGGCFGRRSGGWWIVAEIELHLGRAVVVPDVSGWRRTRMPSPPQGPFQTLAPDWVCEITSPASAGDDRIRKLRIYRGAGVGHVWLADPMARTLEVFRHADDGYVQVQGWQGDERVRAEPFESEEFDLAEWWPPVVEP